MFDRKRVQNQRNSVVHSKHNILFCRLIILYLLQTVIGTYHVLEDLYACRKGVQIL